MIAFLANWRIIALGAAVAGVVGLWLYVGHLRSEVAQQRARAEVAESAAAMRAVETKTIENYHVTERVITKEAEKRADAVASIPSDDIPPNVKEAWLSGLSAVQGATNSIE